ncbi:MAG: hypothetical protein ACKVOI_03775 [Dongiaceae bacterium]
MKSADIFLGRASPTALLILAILSIQLGSAIAITLLFEYIALKSMPARHYGVLERFTY